MKSMEKRLFAAILALMLVFSSVPFTAIELAAGAPPAELDVPLNWFGPTPNIDGKQWWVGSDSSWTYTTELGNVPSYKMVIPKAGSGTWPGPEITNINYTLPADVKSGSRVYLDLYIPEGQNSTTPRVNAAPAFDSQLIKYGGGPAEPGAWAIYYFNVDSRPLTYLKFYCTRNDANFDFGIHDSLTFYFANARISIDGGPPTELAPEPPEFSTDLHVFDNLSDWSADGGITLAADIGKNGEAAVRADIPSTANSSWPGLRASKAVDITGVEVGTSLIYVDIYIPEGQSPTLIPNLNIRNGSATIWNWVLSIKDGSALIPGEWTTCYAKLENSLPEGNQAITFFEFWLYQGDLPASSTFIFSNMRIVPELPIIPPAPLPGIMTVASDRVGNIFEGSEPANMAVTLTSGVGGELYVNAAYTLINAWGETVETGIIPNQLIGANETIIIDLPIIMEKYGVYDLIVDVKSTDAETLIDLSKTVDISRIIATTANRGGSFFGMQVHGLPKDIDYPKTLALGGCTYIRTGISWETVEPTVGRGYSIPQRWLEYIDELDAQGIHMIFEFGFTHDSGYWRWAHDRTMTDEQLDAFIGYVRYLVTNLKDKVHVWELWNEPEAWVTAETYVRAMNATRAAVKEIDPDATIIGGGLSGNAWYSAPAWVKTILTAEMDALSFHPYNAPRSPETTVSGQWGLGVLDSIAMQKSMVREIKGKDLPLWITEMGWRTGSANPSSQIPELTMAEYLVRFNVLALSDPLVQAISWYDFKNDGINPAEDEENYGLLRNELDPKTPYGAKAGFAAGAAMANKLLCVEDIDISHPAGNPNIYLAKGYRPGDNMGVWVLWNNGASSVNVDLELANGIYAITDMFGNAQNVEVNNGLLSVTATGAPIYIDVEPTALFYINGTDSIASGPDAYARYVISAEHIPALSAAEVVFEVDGGYLSTHEINVMGGFSFMPLGAGGAPILWSNSGDKWTGKALLINMGNTIVSGKADLLELVFKVSEGVLGQADIKLLRIFPSYAGATVDNMVVKDTATTFFTQYYSIYDLNKDGVIDLNDLTYALQFLLAEEGDANWDEAKAVDYTNNRKVEVDDLLLILANYTIPYYG